MSSRSSKPPRPLTPLIRLTLGDDRTAVLTLIAAEQYTVVELAQDAADRYGVTDRLVVDGT